MLRKIALTLAGLLTICTLAVAQPNRPSAANAKENDKQEEKKVELKVTPGMVGVAHNENDWYFDVPDDLLGRRMLAVTRFTSMTVGAGNYGGEEVNEKMIYWEKAPNGNLLLRADVRPRRGSPSRRRGRTASRPWTCRTARRETRASDGT